MAHVSFMIMGDPDVLAVAVPVTTMWAAPDAPRDVDAPIVARCPDARAWVDGLSHEDRLGLGGRALTQVLYGEPVHLVAEEGEWAAVIAPWQPCGGDPRGYPGWVPRAHLADAPPATGREAVVSDDTARVGEVEATYATILPVVAETAGGVRVALPGGGEERLDASGWTIRDAADRSPQTVDPLEVVAEARRFTGLPYLWAGMSARGLDCSGLVHIAYRALGAVVPRDAQDQAVASTLVPLSEVEPGDLYFYARPGRAIHHVGFALDDRGRVLHAPGTGEAVIDEPMKPERLDTIIPLAGRFRP